MEFCFMHLLFGLLIWNIYITSSVNAQIVNEYPSKSYCYDGKQRVVVCNNNMKISIMEIFYEINCESKCACTDRQKQLTCEPFNPNSWENYDVYNAISGESSNYITADRKRCGGLGNIFSNLMHMNYSCVTNDNIIQFGDVTNTAGSIVYIQYVGGKHTQNDWYCTASTTSSHDIQVSSVDVRFQRYGVSTGRCDGGLSYLYLSDSNHNSTIRCQDQTILGNYDTIFSSTESTITIQLHLDGDPQFVWVAVSAGRQEHVNVTCHYVIPTSPPSTTIKTTSGVISSQTTDLIVKSTPNIIENNSNKTLELSTQVIDTTTSRRNLSTKTDLQSDLGFIALSTAGVVILLLILIGVIVGKRRFMQNRLQRNCKDNVERTNQLILTDTRKQDRVKPSSLHRHDDNDASQMSSSDNVTHKKAREEPSSLSTDSHKDHIYSSLKMSSSDNVTHKKARGEPSSLSSHKDNDSLMMPLGDNIHAEWTDISNVYSQVNKHRNIDESSNYYDITNHSLYPKQTSTSDGYSHVNKLWNIDESSNYYDRTNHSLYPKQTSTSGSTDHVYDRVQQYGHYPVPTPDSQYMVVKIAKSDNGSLSVPNNVQFHPPDELFPDATSFSDHIPSPYVDEAVKKGMDSEQQRKISRSSTLSFENNYDAAIRDLMKEAEDWASKDK